MYAINLKLIPLILCLGLFFSTALASFLSRKMQRIIFGTLAVAALLLILRYSVFGRLISDNHRFAFFAQHSNEFWREMIMNGVLYYPLGITLPYVIGKYRYSVLTGFALSVLIEAWQYFAGAGLAQGSDVIMNTLGVAVGGLSFLVYSYWQRESD